MNIDFSEMVDSRDIIERLEELRDLREDEELDADDLEELQFLEAIEEGAQHSPDWEYGEALINDDYFTSYIKQLIHDCYDIPTNTDWPFNHMKMDYEAAAEEAKIDYIEFEVDGNTFLIRG